MLVADARAPSIQAVSAALLLTGAAEIWMLAALMALYGTADAFFGPAMSGLIPQTVADAPRPGGQRADRAGAERRR